MTPANACLTSKKVSLRLRMKSIQYEIQCFIGISNHKEDNWQNKTHLIFFLIDLDVFNCENSHARNAY